MKVANCIIGLAVLAMAQLAQAQLGVGENTKITAGGLFSFGYSGDYGDAIPSDHGLTFGLDGKLSGYYYNPSFISFTATPYWNQSRDDSSYQSLTGASGVSATANFFTGSHFPGSVTYRYDANSTGTFGLPGQPNFTTYGRDQGFGINWGAYLPGLPTLSVGYSQGSGNGTIYGTDQEADSSTRLFNLRSTYQVSGFHLTGYFSHNTLDSTYPEFLSDDGQAVESSSGHDFGFGAQHNLPIHGLFYVNYNRSSQSADFVTTEEQSPGTSNTTNYTDSTETAGATFHPTRKLSFNVTQNYTDNLSGYLAQSLGNGSGGAPLGVNLGTGSDSSTLGGGLNYQFTNYLSASAQATYYNQHYFGNTYTGEYVSGTVNYAKRLFNMFSFSGSVIDSSNGQGQNSVGFMGNVNYFHRIAGWQTSGQFSYAQNVQTLLITYTSSYYNYSANVRRRLPGGLQWIAAFTGNRSGLTQYQGTNTHSESYSTSLSMRRLAVNGFYSQSTGVQLLGAGGPISPAPTPGLTDFILFTGDSYGGGISVTPVKRLTVAGTFSRAISDTITSTTSHNNTEIINAQLQYHLRRIGLQAGYTQFTQGISAIGAPVGTTSYYVGITRWFDFF
jgi:hypothetical protein